MATTSDLSSTPSPVRPIAEAVRIAAVVHAVAITLDATPGPLR